MPNARERSITYANFIRERVLASAANKRTSPSDPQHTSRKKSAAPGTPPSWAKMSAPRADGSTQEATLHSLEDAAPAPAPATLGGLDDVDVASPSASTPSASGHPTIGAPGRFGSSPRGHYLLSASSQSSSAGGSDGSGTPLQPSPLPAITLPMTPAVPTAASSESSYGTFGTPRSRASETGSLGSMASLVGQDSGALGAHHMAGQDSPVGTSSPLRNSSPARSQLARAASPGMVAAGVMGTSISLQKRPSGPLPLEQQTSGAADTPAAAAAPAAPAAAAPGVAKSAAAAATALAAAAAAAMPKLSTRVSPGSGSARSSATGEASKSPLSHPVKPGSSSSSAGSSSAGGSSSIVTSSSGSGSSAGGLGNPLPKPPTSRTSRSSKSRTPRHGVTTTSEISEAGSSSSSRSKQQQTSAVAALTADIIAAAAAGAAAGAALAAIAEAGEDQQQRSQMQGLFPTGTPAATPPRGQKLGTTQEATRHDSPRGKQLASSAPEAAAAAAAATAAATAAAAAGTGGSIGSASSYGSGSGSGSSPRSEGPSSPGFAVVDPAAAAAAAKSARRRSRSSRSRTSSTAGGKPQADIAAQADIEQPPAMAPRSLQQQQQKRRSSAGGGKKTLIGSLTALLGVGALKRGAKQPPAEADAPTPGPDPTLSDPSASAAAQEKQPDTPSKAQPQQQARKKKCITWTLLVGFMLALLFGIIVAIAVPVSRQNAANRAAAAAAAKGRRGPPLTFKIDVAVPPDGSTSSEPVCGSLFGKAQDSSRRVEGYLGVFRKAYANSLGIKPSEVNINSVTCNNMPVSAAVPQPPTAPRLPRPALKKRLLLSEDGLGLDRPRPHRTLAQAGAGAPATLSTEFQVPAPADPAEREKLASQIKESSSKMLTGPLSDFFGRPVTVSAPQQLQEPTKKPQVSSTAQVPRTVPRSAPAVIPVASPVPLLDPVPSPSPSPSPSPKPSPELQREVPVEVIEEAIEEESIPIKKPAQPPAARPKQPPGRQNQTVEEIPSVPLQLPKVSPKPAAAKPVSPPGVNATTSKPVKQPTRVILWPLAPACKGKPDGMAEPDSEGRLWGWQNGQSCTFKTLLRTPVYIAWGNAPTCKEAPSTSNSIYDRSGRLWGWQDDRSCAFRGTRLQVTGEPGKPALTWPSAPACRGVPNTLNSVKTRAGEIWGWEDGASCAFRIQDNGFMWLTAPKCKGLSNYYNSVRDSLGRSWGWEDNRSCRY